MNPKLLILTLLFGVIFFQSRHFNRKLKVATARTLFCQPMTMAEASFSPPILSHPIDPIQPVPFPELKSNEHTAQ